MNADRTDRSRTRAGGTPRWRALPLLPCFALVVTAASAPSLAAPSKAFPAASASASATGTADAREACANSYTEAQRERKRGELAAARRSLLSCARDACPEFVRTDCARWLGEIDAETPTLVVRVRRSDGTDVPGAVVLLAGRQWPLDGKPRELDPGRYRLTASAPGHKETSTLVVVAQGEKGRVLALTLEPLAHMPTARKPAPRPRLNLSWPTFAFGGVALLGLGAFTGFGLAARSADRDLAGCAAFKGCSQSDVDSVKQEYLLANVSLGVGVAGAAGAAIWMLLVPAPSPTTPQLTAGPTFDGRGAQLGFVGAF